MGEGVMQSEAKHLTMESLNQQVSKRTIKVVYWLTCFIATFPHF